MKTTYFKFLLLGLFSFLVTDLSFGQNHFIEGFENPGSWSGYTTGTVNFDSGNWNFVQVFNEFSSDSYDGSNACRINDDEAGASITSPSVNGVGTISFYYHRPFGGVGSFELQKSVGGGAYTTLVTVDFTSVTSPTEYTYDVNDASNNIKIRIVNDNNSAHLTIDNFTMGEAGGNASPDITNISISPSSPTSSDAVTVSADVTDTDGTINNVKLNWGTTSGSLGNTINMSSTTGDTYEIDSDIPTQADGTTVYYEIAATDDEPETTTSAEQSYDVNDPVTLPYSEDFTGQNGKGATGGSSVTFDLAGIDWTLDINESGLGSSSDYFRVENEEFSARDVDEEQVWNSPVIDISGETDIDITIDVSSVAGELENSDYIETGYVLDGGSFTTITKHDGEITGTVTDSESLTGLSNNTLKIVIKVDNNVGSEFYYFDNVSVGTPSSAPSITLSQTSLSALDYVDGNGPSAEQSFTAEGSNLTDDITLTAPTNFEISTSSGSGFGSSVTLTPSSGTVSTTDIYVRLASGLAVNTYSGTLTATSSGATQRDVSLSGEVTASGGGGTTTCGVEIDFETQGAGYNTSIVEFTDNDEDYFTQTTQSDISASFTGADGSFFAAQDIDDQSATLPVELTIDNIDISTLTNLEFSIDLAEDGSSGSDHWDDDDYVRIYYTIDSGTEQNLLWIQNDGTTFNTAPLIDTDFDGIGDGTEITNTFATFTESIGSTGSSMDVRIEFSLDAGDEDIALDNISVCGTQSSTSTTYIFDAGSWSPNDPVTGATPSTAADDIEVDSGTPIISGTLVGNNLTISSGATLELGASAVLNLDGDITNDGNITFKSELDNSVTPASSETAQLDEFTGSISGSGDVTVERFIPAGDNDLRAFRFLSTAVNSNGTIFANWQQSGLNPGDTGYEPGFGTHITGAQGTVGNISSDGFDETGSGNPSLLIYDNTSSPSSNGWSFIDNTNNTNLEAGHAYNLFVRGDRGVDLTASSDSQDPTNTRLRSTGDLVTGSLTTGSELPSLASGADEWSLIGNPYQAIVDFNDLTFNDDIKDTFFVIWDPNAGNNQGSYETIDSQSTTPQMIQPGQSFFVQNSGTVNTQPTIEFTESAKNTSGTVTSVFSTNDVAVANLELYDTNNTKLDVMKFRFEAGADNGLDDYDAGKLGNPTENLASVNGSTLLSIERRAIPSASDTIPLFINQYQFTDYEFQLNTSNWDDSIDVYLKDDYLDEVTPLEADDTFSFTVDANIPESIATDRFSLIFENTTLGVNDNESAKQINLYPNPTGGQFTIQSQDMNADSRVTIYDMSGKQVFRQSYPASSNGELNVNAGDLSAGVYMVEMNNANKETYTTRLIVK